MAQQPYKHSLGGFIWQSFLGIFLLLFISWAAIKVANNLSIEPVFALAFMVVGLLVIFLLFRLLFPPTSVEALENAEYWLNYAQEAVAYQKIADYTTNISSDSSVDTAINAQKASLKSDLGVLANKILHAKAELGKVLNEK